MSDYPELDKMKASREENKYIVKFLEWLDEKGIILCRFEEAVHIELGGDEYEPIRKSIEQLLADYFEIDMVKAEKERQAILEDIRKG